MIRFSFAVPAAALALVPFVLAQPALAQKQGGILKLYHRDSPASASIHEEATTSTTVPFMAVFNNLVIYDQNVAQNSDASIRPDLAESWAWSDDKTQLTFKLHAGVKWHDGKPFTAKDVQCTFDMLTGKSESKLRKNPRASWYTNLDSVSVNGDLEATFHLKRPQPSFMAMLASGDTPIYPCHVPANVMRTKPVGTGPFKFAEFRANDMIRLVRNPDYFKPGRPYLDGIEYKIVANRSTAILAFVSGTFDMTFPDEVSAPLMKDVKAQVADAVCVLPPNNVTNNLIINREAPPFDNPEIRRAMMLTLDRKAFIDILSEGHGEIGGTLLPAPSGVWGAPADYFKDVPGFGPDVQKNREEGRAIMKKLGYGPENTLKVKIATRNAPIFRDPAVILLDQLKQIYIEGELEIIETSTWQAKIARKDYKIGANMTGNALDDPDQNFYENYSCKSERNYTQYCNPELEKMFDQQSQEPDFEKRKQLVWTIDKKLQEDAARPIIYHNHAGTCWHPRVKNVTVMVNSVYNGWRFEDVWLDK